MYAVLSLNSLGSWVPHITDVNSPSSRGRNASMPAMNVLEYSVTNPKPDIIDVSRLYPVKYTMGIRRATKSMK